MTAEALSSKGVAMYLTTGAPAKGTVVPTAINKGAPVQVTAPAPTGGVTSYAITQIVYADDTGFTELDEKYWVIDGLMADDAGFVLAGADTTNSTGTLVANPKMTVYDSGDMVKMCLNNFAFNLETPGTINVGTYCNPQATLPSTPTGVGSATLGGWIDINDPAYVELLKAEQDGATRVFSILLPQQQGYIVAPITIDGITWDIPLEGGMAFTATATLKAKPRHLFTEPAPEGP